MCILSKTCICVHYQCNTLAAFQSNYKVNIHRSNDVTSIKQGELGKCTVRSILSQYRQVLRKHCIMSNNNITIFFSLVRVGYH